MGKIHLIAYSTNDGHVAFRVQVVPRASRSEIVGEHNGAVRIRVAAPPVEGAANEELVRIIAKVLKVSRRSVQITSGHSSRIKQLVVANPPENFLELLTRR